MMDKQNTVAPLGDVDALSKEFSAKRRKTSCPQTQSSCLPTRTSVFSREEGFHNFKEYATGPNIGVIAFIGRSRGFGGSAPLPGSAVPVHILLWFP